ncbi:hypothetical protein P2318_03990 [Myxococcaceae bacterium GXIMD 01537]
MGRPVPRPPLTARQSRAPDGCTPTDPSDDSVWAGARWGGGLSRARGSTVTHHGASVLGATLAGMPVSDVQVDRSTSPRRVLVAFQGTNSQPGAIGIYTGP